MRKPILCRVCGKTIKLVGDNPHPYTAIEHYHQKMPCVDREIFFHTDCFLKIAGKEYGPKSEASENIQKAIQHLVEKLKP